MMDIVKYETLSVLAGPLAFVLTAGHMVLGLQFYFRIFVLGSVPGRGLFVFFIVTGIVACVAWFVHLWPLHNLYVRTAILLEVIGALILLMHAIYHTRPN